MNLYALTNAELTALKTALLNAIMGIATSQSYKIGDRSISRMPASECRTWLDAVNATIEHRASSNAGIAFVEFEDPSL